MRRFALMCGLLLVCGMVGVGDAAAQVVVMETPGGPVDLGTPDGQPPSVETVCDGQQGAAFGLCNAYCEAMDCDSPDAQASQQACDKVSDKFSNITGKPLPCEMACPCIDAIPSWTAFIADPGIINSCGSCQDSNSTQYCASVQLSTFQFPVAWDGGDILGLGSENGCGEAFSRTAIPLTQGEARACQDFLQQFHEENVGTWSCQLPTNRD